LRRHRGQAGIAKTDWKRRFIHGASRGCKVRATDGIHHRPSRGNEIGATQRVEAARCERGFGGEPKARLISTSEPSRHRGDLVSGNVGGARDQRRCGVTRRFSLAKPEGEGTGVTRGVHQLAPEDAASGETRKLIVGDTEGTRTRGNLNAFDRHRRKMRSSIRLGGASPAKPENAGGRETCAALEGCGKNGKSRGNPDFIP